jgi:hypothetical protein
MTAGTTRITRSYAQFQGNFWGDALDEVGDFIGMTVLVRGLVGKEFYEFLRHGGSVIS